MSLLKQTLYRLDFPREINTFLSLLQSKAGFGSAKIDELYGLLPPLEITFQKTNQYKPNPVNRYFLLGPYDLSLHSTLLVCLFNFYLDVNI